MEEAKCREHDKEGSFYCGSASCMRVFCQSCAYKHCQHDFWVVDDSFQQRIERKLLDLLENLRTDCDHSQSELDRLQLLNSALREDAATLTQQVSSKFDTAIQRLTQQKTDLLANINEREMQLAEQLSSATQHCAQVLEQQIQARDSTDGFLKRFRAREAAAQAGVTGGLLTNLKRGPALGEMPTVCMGLDFIWDGDEVDWELGSLAQADTPVQQRTSIYFFRDYSKVVWKLDRRTMQWSELSDSSLPMFRSLSVAYNNQDDSYSIFGTTKLKDVMVVLSTAEQRFSAEDLPFSFPMWSCAAWLGKSVYLLGGQVGENSLSDCRKYTSGFWTTVQDLNCARDSSSAVGYKAHLYIFGGYFNHQLLCSIEKYDAVKDYWLMCRLRMPTALAYVGVVQVATGLVLLGGEGQSVASCEVYYWDTSGELKALDKLQQGFTNHLTASAEMSDDTVFLLETESQTQPTVREYQLTQLV